MSTNVEPMTAVIGGDHPATVDQINGNRNALHDRTSLTEALTLRRNLLQSLWIGVRQLPRGRRIVLMIRLCVSFAQIIAFIPILALPGSHRVSPSHETGRVCDPDSLFKYLVVHIVRLALDIPVELYLGLSPHRTRQGRRAGPEARAIAERDRPLGSEYLDVKVGKISTLLGIASLVIFFVGNAIVYSSTECSRRPADAIPLFWAALSSLIVVYIFIVEIALLAFLIVCALPVLIVVLRALGLNHRLPQRELHPETGKIGQEEVDKRVKLVYYTPAEEEEDEEGEGQTQGDNAAEQSTPVTQTEATKLTTPIGETASTRPGIGSRRPTSETVQTATSHPALGTFSRLTRILVARRRSATKVSASSPNTPHLDSPSNPTTSTTTTSKAKSAKKGSKLKYPLHPLPAHRATCPICLCDFEEPEVDAEPEPEPLRLLECGHVMHRSCVDQWLTTVSGRCPVCQKAVIPELETRGEETTQASAIANANQGANVQPEVVAPQPIFAEGTSQTEMVETETVQQQGDPSCSRTNADTAQGTQVESHELQPLSCSSNRTEPPIS